MTEEQANKLSEYANASATMWRAVEANDQVTAWVACECARELFAAMDDTCQNIVNGLLGGE